MKNINSLIGRLSHSGLLSKSSRGRSRGSLAAVGGMAWSAYQVYSQQAYGRNTTLNRANMQRAYQLGVYAQRNAEQSAQHKAAPTQQIEPSQQSVSAKPISQSRYIPSTHNHNLTYSPASLSLRHFEQVIEDEHQQNGQLLILRAMITAANADGHIDEAERQQIFQQVDKFELTTEDKASLFDELRQPLSLDELIQAIPNSQTTIEVYAASLLAIDEQQKIAQAYLKRLASQLSIPDELVNAMHRQAQEMDRF